jgi:hypothetical protein
MVERRSLGWLAVLSGVVASACSSPAARCSDERSQCGQARASIAKFSEELGHSTRGEVASARLPGSLGGEGW